MDISIKKPLAITSCRIQGEKLIELLVKKNVLHSCLHPVSTEANDVIREKFKRNFFSIFTNRLVHIYSDDSHSQFFNEFIIHF